MSSIKKRVSNYFRQLSFHNESSNEHGGNKQDLITNYMLGKIHKNPTDTTIISGKLPGNLPNVKLGSYSIGVETVTGCCTGPGCGLTNVRTLEKHLGSGFLEDDIEYIDNLADVLIDSIGSVTKKSTVANKWNCRSDFAYGMSDSLYDTNPITKVKNGHPIADCYGLITRTDSALLAVADGVNWGEKASIAAQSAIHGALKYLNECLFNDTSLFMDENSIRGIHKPIINTNQVFTALLRAFNAGHHLIIDNGGSLTTLTVLVVLPTIGVDYVCCTCTVGDSLAFVYSSKTGTIKELTQASHDIYQERDIRNALGALGPTDEHNNPDISNLTMSITMVKPGDIVFVCSDGICDNFDPCVCQFATSPHETNTNSTNYKPQRSKTLNDIHRRPKCTIVNPIQRYELQLLFLQDTLNRRKMTTCTAKLLCERLQGFAFNATKEKRRILENPQVYYKHSDNSSQPRQLSDKEQRIGRKKLLNTIQHLSGKLDHATVIAWNVANVRI